MVNKIFPRDSALLGEFLCWNMIDKSLLSCCFSGLEREYSFDSGDLTQFLASLQESIGIDLKMDESYVIDIFCICK